MAQAPETAGGGGFTFEDRVSASYLAALLQQGFAPGISGRTVCRVALQQRAFGEPLDDVVVDYETDEGDLARLCLQVKQSLRISSARSNTDFQDVIRDCWSTFKKVTFRMGTDRYGPAVGYVATAKARDLQRLSEVARASATVADFEARFSPGGNASASVGRIKDDIASLVKKASGSACSGQELKDFLAHFVLIEFDFLHEGQTDAPAVLNGLRACLASGEVAQASALWDRLCTVAREGTSRSAVFDRPGLVRSLSSMFRLVGGPSFRLDLERLRSLAQQWLADIEDDVGGTRLARRSLLTELEVKLTSSRWVQIRGLPGSGKSVLLRRQVEADLGCGPVLFLKSDRLEGTGWGSFANANGISNAGLPDLLVELAATGSNTLYIDGIDRIEKQHQPIILDLVRAIVEEPLLDNWQVVVSLRDTGIEPLRNWLGNVLAKTRIGTLEVKSLDDEEATLLAKAKPQLQPLLFGPKQVREVVRRPFFAKILNQNFASSAGDDAFHPQSEVDLVGNWWARGGYDAEGQNALERQRAIVELGIQRARHLERDIAVRELSPSTISVIDQLLADGILRHVRVGHSLRFSHDIFFEWALFHVLSGEDDWLEEIRTYGEPPAVARVVELISQWEFGQGDLWARTLNRLEGSSMRSQWTRAWLLAPLAVPNFRALELSFSAALEANEHRFLKKALVWFQAEKTTPNSMMLEANLPQEERIRLADLMGWPSDLETWSRFIAFLLTRISTIPVTFYPDVVSIFEVWQNAFSGTKNAISDALLDQIAAWLTELTQQSTARRPSGPPSRWEPLGSALGDFRRSLTQLILRSAGARPDLTKEYLTQIISSKDELRREKFKELVAFSPILARTHPAMLVDLTLKHLRRELPEGIKERERHELSRYVEGRKRALAKPPEERTRADRLAIEGQFFPLGRRSFDYHDWNELAIEDDLSIFYPPSPLREPFYSLFTFAPEHALRLVAELSNHAMSAWRQLHNLAHDTPGSPVPLDIDFPWGKQQFWGGDREYLWSRGMWAPKPIACCYLGLEEWALGELERGRPVDELIQQIVSGNQCIAVLGVAVAIALQTEAVSDVVFPIVTSQRLLTADHYRMLHDYTSATAGLIGFSDKDDLAHVEAVEKINARQVRRRQLRWLLSLYFFNAKFKKRTKAAVLDFVNALPFEIEEHRAIPEAQEHLRQQAVEYAELVDLDNYQRVAALEGDDQVAIAHVSPTATSPERVAQAEEAGTRLREGNLWTWGSKYFETGQLGEGFTVQSAIDLAKSIDGTNLFDEPGNDADMADIRRGAVSVAAAVALDSREGVSSTDLTWARDVLKRAISATEKQRGSWSPRSVIPWHPSNFAARGLAADLRSGTADQGAAVELLALVGHPSEGVSLTALEAALSLWDHDPRLGWSALHLALSLCVLPPVTEATGEADEIHTLERVRSAIDKVTRIYEETKVWSELALPPPAWVKVEDNGEPLRTWELGDRIRPSDLVDPGQRWAPSPVRWNRHYATQVMSRVPLATILTSTAAPRLLDLLSGQLAWTISKLSPPWVRQGRRGRNTAHLYEWTQRLGFVLGQVAGMCPLAEVEARFLEPIFALEGDHCWQLLARFADGYICMHVYDAEEVPSDAPVILMRCLDRFLKASPFNPETYRSGELHGFNQPRLAKTLMFVSIDEPAPGAARYVNGDWSDLDLVLPVVDRFVRSAGWISIIMSHFLRLSERAKKYYPVEVFADQVLHVINGAGPSLKGWHGTFLPARIAGLVQYFADRETPMPLELGQRLLRILDVLVDMGDRRSAALQLSESFREIKTVPEEV